MWELISVVAEMLFDKFAKDEVMSLLIEKAPKFAKIVKTLGDLKTKAQQVQKYLKLIDPNELLRGLKSLPRKILNKFLNDKRISLGVQFKDAQDFVDFEKAQKRKENMTMNKMWEKYSKGSTEEWVMLNSSWINSGKYNSSKDGIGALSIIVNSNGKSYGPYTYPSVPLYVWKYMTSSKNHAGTIFWKLYLHSFIHSSLRLFAYQEILGDIKGKLAFKNSAGKRFDIIRNKMKTLTLTFYKNKKRIQYKKVDKYSWYSNALKRHRETKALWRKEKAIRMERRTRMVKVAQHLLDKVRERRKKFYKLKRNIRETGRIYREGKSIVKKASSKLRKKRWF